MIGGKGNTWPGNLNDEFIMGFAYGSEEYRNWYINQSGTERSGDYTGRCPKCGSTDIWDDNRSWGCNKCDFCKIDNC